MNPEASDLRVSKFVRDKQRELLAEGFTVNNIFDLPNYDDQGLELCGIDTMVIGFEIAIDGKTVNRFYGETTFLLWDESELLDWDATEEEIEAAFPLTTVSEKIEGKFVHIDSEKHPNHYKSILDAAKSLKLQGIIDYDRLKDAARRYILSVQTRCKAKNLNPPRMSAASLMR